MKYIKWGIICHEETSEVEKVRTFGEIEGSSIVAIMSNQEKHAEDMASRLNAGKWYSDAQELIEDEEVNAIYIASSPSTHATYSIMSMKAGKPVFVNSPLAADYDDCIRINRISTETGIPCYVAYYHRNLPCVQKVREIIAKGLIGDVVNVRLIYSCQQQNLPQTHGNSFLLSAPHAAGHYDYFYKLASHQLDLLQHVFGIIIEANGIISDNIALTEQNMSVNACYKFENGLTGNASWCLSGHSLTPEDEIMVIGNKGQLTFPVFRNVPIELVTSEGTVSFPTDNPSDMRLPLIKNVIEDLQGFNVCLSTSVSATPVNWVLDRILAKF